MKIQPASDLHLEFLQLNFPGKRVVTPAAEAEILVLPGDIANGTQAIELLKDWPVPFLTSPEVMSFTGHAPDCTTSVLGSLAIRLMAGRLFNNERLKQLKNTG